MTETTDIVVVEKTATNPPVRLLNFALPEPIVIEGFDEAFAAVQARIDDIYSDESIAASTDDSLNQAKKDRAGLNAQARRVDERRKEIERAYTGVVKPFKEQMDKLRDLYKSAADKYGVLIREVEDKQKASKRMEAAQYYAELAPVLADALPFDRIFDPAWDKAAYTIKHIQVDIDEKVQRIAGDIGVIEQTCGDWAAQCKIVYMDKLDLSDAMAEKTRLEDIAERTRRMDEERAAIKDAQQVAAEAAVVPDAPEAAPEIAPEPPVAATAPQVPPQPPQQATATPQRACVGFTLRFEGNPGEINHFAGALKKLAADYPSVQYKQIQEAK